MARNRMLNPEFWLDEDLAKLSAYARLLYQGLWGICDDNYATLPNKQGWIKVQIFPYNKVDIAKLLDELSTSGHLILFEHEGQEFWFIKNFFKHQKVDRPSKPKYPKFEANSKLLDESSMNTRPEEKISKDKLRKENVESSPSYLLNIPLEDFKDIEASERQIRLEGEKAHNWILAQGKIKKNYKAFLRNWVLKTFHKKPQNAVTLPDLPTEVSESGLAKLAEMKKKILGPKLAK
jgi:hypothetical protein